MMAMNQTAHGESSPNQCSWTSAEHTQFETALVTFPKDTPGRWSKIAGSLSTKSPSEVQEQYEKLVDDVNLILPGRIQLPHCGDDSPPRNVPAGSPTQSSWNWEEVKQFLEALEAIPDGTPDRCNKIAGLFSTKSPAEVQEHYGRLVADNGTESEDPWTREQHNRFLFELTLFGSQDWRAKVWNRHKWMAKTPAETASSTSAPSTFQPSTAAVESPVPPPICLWQPQALLPSACGDETPVPPPIRLWPLPLRASQPSASPIRGGDPNNNSV